MDSEMDKAMRESSAEMSDQYALQRANDPNDEKPNEDEYVYPVQPVIEEAIESIVQGAIDFGSEYGFSRNPKEDTEFEVEYYNDDMNKVEFTRKFKIVEVRD